VVYKLKVTHVGGSANAEDDSTSKDDSDDEDE